LPVRRPPGLAHPAWQIFQELSEAMGRDMGLTSLDAIHEEMGEVLAPREAGAASATVPATTAPPGDRSEGELTLFSYPLLVDEGRLSVGAEELKEALEQEAFAEVNPADAARLELVDGGRARVETERGAAELPVRVTDGVAAGSVFVPWNQPGLQANTLLAGRLTAPVTLSPVGEPAMAAAGEEES
ncbi:MAG TPA: molybdopterin dinucleotide binding domain-containing protein, partial [Actinomycetota bacterium]|nr:molybdopterin dinucleotide binding domain-containing protein [Actinomycetota bacterium]